MPISFELLKLAYRLDNIGLNKESNDIHQLVSLAAGLLDVQFSDIAEETKRRLSLLPEEQQNLIRSNPDNFINFMNEIRENIKKEKEEKHDKTYELLNNKAYELASQIVNLEFENMLMDRALKRPLENNIKYYLVREKNKLEDDLNELYKIHERLRLSSRGPQDLELAKQTEKYVSDMKDKLKQLSEKEIESRVETQILHDAERFYEQEDSEPSRQ